MVNMAPAQNCISIYGLLVFLCCLFATHTENLNLIILHTNDILSHYDDFNETFGECKDSDIVISTTEYIDTSTQLPTTTAGSTAASTDGNNENSRQFGENNNKVLPENTTECFGGLSRLVTKSKQYISEANKDAVVLFLNSGNTFGQTIWHPILGWSPAAYSVHTLGYNVMSLGVREFEDGIEHLTNYLRNITSPCVVVAANIDFIMEKELVQYFRRSYIVRHNDQKIGIIGYTSKTAEYMSDPGNLRFSSEVEAVKEEAKMLNDGGVKIIIALGSAGNKVAEDIANNVDYVDIVVSGGDMSLFYHPQDQSPSTEEAVHEYPYIVNNKLIVQTYPYGKYLGLLDTTFDADGKRTAVNPRSNSILLNSAVEQDPDVVQRVQEWAEKVKTTARHVVGKTKVYLNGSREECWTQECTMGNLVTDASLWYLNRYVFNGSSWQGSVTVALWHSSTMNGSITNEDEGLITVGDLFRSFPYHNTLCFVTMKGSDLKDMFEKAVSKYKQGGTMYFLQVSGVQVTYDISQSPYSRVRELLVSCLDCSTPQYLPVEKDAEYSVAVPSYLAHGRMYKEMLKHEINDTEIADDDILKAYIGVMSPLTTAKEGRIRFYESTPPIVCTSKTETVFVTLVVVAAIGLCGFIVYKYILPRCRRRYGSTMALVH